MGSRSWEGRLSLPALGKGETENFFFWPPGKPSLSSRLHRHRSRPDFVKNLTLSRSFTKNLQLVREEGKTKFFQFETSKYLLWAIGKSELGQPFLKFAVENISFCFPSPGFIKKKSPRTVVQGQEEKREKEKYFYSRSCPHYCAGK